MSGINADEAEEYSHGRYYSANDEANRDMRIKGITQALIDGTLGHRIFNNVYGDLMYRNDEYFVLKDFASYLDTWKRMTADHADSEKWNRMSLINTAKAGPFSSDRTIREYAKDIWKL